MASLVSSLYFTASDGGRQFLTNVCPFPIVGSRPAALGANSLPTSCELSCCLATGSSSTAHSRAFEQPLVWHSFGFACHVEEEALDLLKFHALC